MPDRGFGVQPIHVASIQNPRVAWARSLKRRAHRDKERAFLIEGPIAVGEALNAGLEIQHLFVSEAHADELAPLRERAIGAGIEVVDVTERVLAAVADTSTPQGLVAAAFMPEEFLPEELDLAVVLASVRDPGNAGTLVRSAVAAGAGAVVFPSGAVDPWHPKTVRASAGLICRLAVLHGGSLPEAFAQLKERGLRLVGADARAERSMHEADLTAPVALVLGNEAWGIGPEAAGLLDEVVGIPMPGPAESLNVSVAGSILLFEIVRQRRSP